MERFQGEVLPTRAVPGAPPRVLGGIPKQEWSRWDTLGRTIYGCSSAAGAFVEVLEYIRPHIDYYKVDLQMVGVMGPASGFLAALVFSLYVEMGSHRGAYAEPLVLWVVVPVLLYWVTRVWILTGRGHMQDDPVKFALKDRTSLICGVIVALVATLARFTPEWLSPLMH